MKLKLFYISICALCLVSCHEYTPFKYETVSMELSNADNSGEGPVDASGPVPKQAYGIKLLFGMHITESTDADINESSYQNQDQVTSFNITSPFSFLNAAPNTSLNQFFNFSAGATGSTINPDMFNRIISGSRYSSSSSSPDWTETRYLLLMNPPDTSGTYIFIVDLTLSDGREFIDTIQAELF